ncbi:MAG: hypothetical protein U5K54_09190 [Cytophagales bacterium]|nr:hypothetical protein [Cytophagales bacterium]
MQTQITLQAKDEKQWHIIANVNHTVSQIFTLSKSIQADAQLELKVKQDIEAGTRLLKELNASADGIQLTSRSFKRYPTLCQRLVQHHARGCILITTIKLRKMIYQTISLTRIVKFLKAIKRISKPTGSLHTNCTEKTGW